MRTITITMDDVEVDIRGLLLTIPDPEGWQRAIASGDLRVEVVLTERAQRRLCDAITVCALTMPIP